MSRKCKPTGVVDTDKIIKNLQNHQFESGYTMDEKHHVIATLMVTGSVVKAARVTGVPARTIRQWQNQKWYPEAYSMVKAQFHKRIDTKLTKIVRTAVHELDKRIREGDVVIDNKGNRHVVPIKASELATVSEKVFKLLALLRGDPTSRVETVSTEKQLAQLEQRMKIRLQDVETEHDTVH